MTRRRLIWVGLWLLVTLGALAWTLAGHLRTPAGVLIFALALYFLGYGVARLIALYRLAHEDPVRVRRAPFRVSMTTGGLISLGPLFAAAANLINIVPAMACLLGGVIIIHIADALFSDGYQGLWIDPLIFFGKLAPPDNYESLLTRKRKSGQDAER